MSAPPSSLAPVVAADGKGEKKKTDRKGARKKTPKGVAEKPAEVFHAVFGPDKGKEEEEVSVVEEIPQIDRLKSLLKSFSAAEVEAVDDASVVSFKLASGTQNASVENLVVNYGALIDEAVDRLFDVAAASKTSAEELDAFRISVQTQVSEAMKNLLDQVKERLEYAVTARPPVEEMRDLGLGRASQKKSNAEESALEAIRALEEERDVLKKQVENLKLQAQNSRRVATVYTLHDGTKHKEEIELLRAQLELNKDVDGEETAKKLEAANAALEDLKKDRKNLLELYQKGTARQRLLQESNEAQSKQLHTLTETLKSVTAANQELTLRLEELEQEKDEFKSSVHGNTEELLSKLEIAELWRKRQVEALSKENLKLQRLLEDERHKSASFNEGGSRHIEMVGSVLDDMITKVNLEKNRLKLQLAHDHFNASM